MEKQITVYKKCENNEKVNLIAWQRKMQCDSATFLLISSGLGRGYEKTARIAVETVFQKWFENEMEGQLMSRNGLEKVQQRWEDLLEETHKQLIKESRSKGVTMGACASMLLLLDNGHYLLAHLGNNRIYRLNGANAEQLTQDHTYGQNAIRRGIMTPEAVKADPHRNSLLQCIGASDTIEPDFITGTATEGDVFFLCSQRWMDVSFNGILPLEWESEEALHRSMDKLLALPGSDASALLAAVRKKDDLETAAAENIEIYEGHEPYVFVSYSHRDTHEIEEVIDLLGKNGVRVWYDDGLHSGDDWNRSIATHLLNAAVCLVLLSANSAASDYVKNELNFALSHRIPIHILLVRSFAIPIDIELMTGRVQMIEMRDAYIHELLHTLPPEVFSAVPHKLGQSVVPLAHPLYITGDEYLERQGTKTYLGEHKALHYPCLIQKDALQAGSEEEAKKLAAIASGVNHPLFPRIYDFAVKNGIAWTYQEYRKVVFLDQYLQSHSLSEDRILQWATDVIDAMEYLFSRGLALRDFARGSIVVLDDEQIGFFRLQHLYYGLVKLRDETRQYYFENTLLQIAVLLAQLCTGTVPLLPIRMIEQPKYGKPFLYVINLVIQKSTRENGRVQYTDFAQLKEDLSKRLPPLPSQLFLSTRRKKLAQYDLASQQKQQTFTDSDSVTGQVRKAAFTSTVEKDFGFDETIVLQAASQTEIQHHGPVRIRIQVFPSKRIFDFTKESIIIGRESTVCDLICKQLYISRLHVAVQKKENNVYVVRDLGTAGGTRVSWMDGTKTCDIRLPQQGSAVEVPSGARITIGESSFLLLDTD